MIVRTYDEVIKLFDEEESIMKKKGYRDNSIIYILDRKCTAIIKGKLTPVVLVYYPYDENIMLLVPSKTKTTNDISWLWYNSTIVEKILKKTWYKYMFIHTNIVPHTHSHENDEWDAYESEAQCCEAEYSWDWDAFVKDMWRIKIKVINRYNPYNPTIGFKFV
jgi:hypothetical protein